MYVGRIVAVGRSKVGANAVLYRVSSRSYPNRRVVENDGKLAVVPRVGFEGDLDKNPYIAYNALRVAGEWAVATNGSHTDPIVEKLAIGMPPRDALVLSLLALDYEKDELSTPRIAGIVPRQGDAAWLAIVRRDALIVKEVRLEAGMARYVATYEADDVADAHASDFDARDAGEAAAFAVSGGSFADLEKPVTSAAAMAGPSGFDLGSYLVEA